MQKMFGDFRGQEAPRRKDKKKDQAWA